ncbi:MAG: ester cyclase [Candidatus Ventricola sp.]
MTEIVRQFFKEGYERKNYDAVMACLSEDYIDHSPAGARGNAQAVEILRIVASQLSELTVDILDLFADGDRVAARVRFEGVHTGVMMGIPATGRRISFEALEHFRVAGGKIAESWGYWPDREIEEKLRSI